MAVKDRDYYSQMGKKGGRPRLPSVEELLQEQAALEAKDKRRMHLSSVSRHRDRLR